MRNQYAFRLSALSSLAPGPSGLIWRVRNTTNHATAMENTLAMKDASNSARAPRYVSGGINSRLVKKNSHAAPTISIGPAKGRQPPGSVRSRGRRDAVRVRVGEGGFAKARTCLLVAAMETIAALTSIKMSPEHASGAAAPFKRGTTSHSAAIHSAAITIIGRL